MVLTCKNTLGIIKPEQKISPGLGFLSRIQSKKVSVQKKFADRVKPVLKDHSHRSPPVLIDHTFLAEGPTFQYVWACHQRPPVLTDHIFVANGVVFQDGLYCRAENYTYMHRNLYKLHTYRDFMKRCTVHHFWIECNGAVTLHLHAHDLLFTLQ